MRSVLSQTHDNLELIISDDASTDNTRDVVGAFDDPRVVYFCAEKNSGASAARNLGLSHARGNLIAFQDSDDEWLLDKLERQVASLSESNAGTGATFGSKLIYGHDLNFIYGIGRVSIAPETGRDIKSGNLTNELLQGNLISPQTLMIRSDVARKVGGFDTRLPCNNDWEYMLRLSTVTDFAYTPEPVVVAYIQSDSIHRRLRSKALSLLVILKKHSDLFSRDRGTQANFLFRAGRHLHHIGHYNGAICCMRRAVSFAPMSPKIWAGLVLSWLRRALP